MIILIIIIIICIFLTKHSNKSIKLKQDKLKECIKNNFNILYIQYKYKQNAYKNNYYNEWRKEIENFLINTATKYTNFDFYKAELVRQYYVDKSIEYFNQLVKDSEIETIIIKFKECIDKHFNTLYIKYKKSIYKDDYGNEFYDRWHEEIKYFLQNVVFEYIELKEELFEDEIVINYYTKEFDDYFFELLKKQPIDDDLDFEVKTGVDYENYIKDVLENFGYNVSTTSTTGDQGVDLIAKKDKSVIAIQCKYYSKPVGNKAVQEVIAGKGFYNCNKAVVISNNLFTKSAKQLADDSNVKLLTIDVGQKIVELDL